MGRAWECDDVTAWIRDVATSGDVGRTKCGKREGKGCNVEWGK